MSRDELGRLAGYVGGTIAALEIGERYPQQRFIAWLDEHFHTERFGLIYQRLLRRDAYPASFRPWTDIEAEATVLRTYELSVVPGLLQTEAYARALLASVDNDVDGKVAARLARQEQVLGRSEPPMFVALIDETALTIRVGDEKVMREQLERLAALGDRWIIQVVPHGAGSYRRLDGPFVIGTVDGSDQVYTPTQCGGYILDNPQTVAEVMWVWEAIRADALPRQQSRELILTFASRL